MSTEELVNIEEENKELELEAIQKIEEDKIRIRKNRLKKKREGRPIYKEVEIDFNSKIQAERFLDFAINELFLDAHLEDRDVQVLVIKNATDKDLSIIKRRKSLSDAEKVITETADKIAEGAIETAQFAAEKVVVPTTKATVKAALGITKGLVKTTAQVGSSLISSTADSAKQMAEELKEDEDILKAKKAVKKLFKRDAKKKEGIRIVKE